MSDALSIGESVSVRYTKWDGTRHWTFPASYLGADTFGRWVGGAPGTVLDRPDVRVTVDAHFVVLFPTDSGHTPCFYERTPRSRNDGSPGLAGVAIYVDITTEPEWTIASDGTSVSMVDLDLDVVARWSGAVELHDEDEFADHQVAMAYPTGVVEKAEANCPRVLASVQANDEPYATVGQAWLADFIASRG